MTQLGDGIAYREKFHRYHAIVLQFSQLAVDIAVVDFARSWLMTPGNVGNVHQPRVLDIFLQLLDQIAFGDLFVKEVVQELNLRMIDSPMISNPSATEVK